MQIGCALSPQEQHSDIEPLILHYGLVGVDILGVHLVGLNLTHGPQVDLQCKD